MTTLTQSFTIFWAMTALINVFRKASEPVTKLYRWLVHTPYNTGPKCEGGGVENFPEVFESPSKISRKILDPLHKSIKKSIFWRWKSNFESVILELLSIFFKSWGRRTPNPLRLRYVHIMCLKLSLTLKLSNLYTLSSPYGTNKYSLHGSGISSEPRMPEPRISTTSNVTTSNITTSNFRYLEWWKLDLSVPRIYTMHD